MTLKWAGSNRIMPLSSDGNPDPNRDTMEGRAVKHEGNGVMEQHDTGRRLTPTQLAIRDRCEQLPKRLQRSIDQFRQSVDLPPLWAGMTGSVRPGAARQARAGA